MQGLIPNSDPFLLLLPVAFSWGPGRTDEDILATARGCRLQPSAISGADKTGNRFPPLQSPGELSVSHYIELREKKWWWGWEGGGKAGEQWGKAG